MSVVKKCFRLLQLRQHFGAGFPEREVIAYLKSWNPKLKQDGYGNLYLINPGTPLLNAHMDTVQSQQCVNNLKSLRLVKWIIRAKDAVIGWDDKCWIAIAMEMYERLWDKVSLLFTRQEEVWAVGASNFVANHSNLLAECKYCLTLDRRNAWDIIWYNNQYCSLEFQNEIARLTKEFGYKPTTGLLSDANKISKVLNCVNLSVGYYNPHQKTEYIKCDDLVNACEAVQYIIEHLEDDYPIYEAPSYNTTKAYNWVYKQPSLYNYPLADDDDEDDDYSRKLKERWNQYRKEKEDKLNEYFTYLNWQIIVKKAIFLTDATDDSNRAELDEGTYDVIEVTDIY